MGKPALICTNKFAALRTKATIALPNTVAQYTIFLPFVKACGPSQGTKRHRFTEVAVNVCSRLMVGSRCLCQLLGSFGELHTLQTPGSLLFKSKN